MTDKHDHIADAGEKVEIPEVAAELEWKEKGGIYMAKGIGNHKYIVGKDHPCGVEWTKDISQSHHNREVWNQLSPEAQRILLEAKEGKDQ